MYVIPSAEVTVWLLVLGSGPYLFISGLGKTKLEKYKKSKPTGAQPRGRNTAYLVDHYVYSFFFFLL